jgi:hypothetical protein
MPTLPLNLKGQVFGLLTATEFVGTDSQGARWLCACECGGTTIKNAKELLRRNGLTAVGYALSCGCRQGDRSSITPPRKVRSY